MASFKVGVKEVQKVIETQASSTEYSNSIGSFCDEWFCWVTTVGFHARCVPDFLCHINLNGGPVIERGNGQCYIIGQSEVLQPGRFNTAL